MYLIAGRTSSTAAADAFDRLVFLQLVFRHAAYAGAVEVRFLCLDAAQAAKLEGGYNVSIDPAKDMKRDREGKACVYLLIALFLPLCDQIRVSVAVL